MARGLSLRNRPGVFGRGNMWDPFFGGIAALDRHLDSQVAIAFFSHCCDRFLGF